MQYIFDKIDCSYFYPDILEFFKNIKEFDNIPNLIFYGPHNTLKYHLVNECIHKLTDCSDINLSTVIYKISTSTNKQIDKEVKQSDYHIIINPTGNNSDRYIVQNIIKKYAQLQVLNVLKLKYKIVLILNAHTLSHLAQASLRRIMEQYNHNCRFFMICDKPLIKPLESRCCHIQIPLPSHISMAVFLKYYALSNNIDIPNSDLYKTAKQFNHNINKLIWYIQYLKYDCPEFEYDFDKLINKIYNMIITKSTTNLIIFMDYYYDCTITGISLNTIIVELTKLFVIKNQFDINIIHKIIKISITCLELINSCRRSHNVFRHFIILIIDVLINS